MRRHLETQHGEEKTTAELFPVPSAHAHSHMLSSSGDFQTGHQVIVA